VTPLEAVLRAGDVFGVLGREVPVKVVNVSASGCLLESAGPLEPGVTGTVSVALDGIVCRDEVRITRCQSLPGSDGRHAMGAHFLWTSQPGAQSLRRVIRQWRGLPPVNGHRFRLVVGRRSSDRRTGGHCSES
jgi:hypothetical protein